MWTASDSEAVCFIEEVTDNQVKMLLDNRGGAVFVLLAFSPSAWRFILGGIKGNAVVH